MPCGLLSDAQVPVTIGAADSSRGRIRSVARRARRGNGEGGGTGFSSRILKAARHLSVTQDRAGTATGGREWAGGGTGDPRKKSTEKPRSTENPRKNPLTSVHVGATLNYGRYSGDSDLTIQAIDDYLPDFTPNPTRRLLEVRGFSSASVSRQSNDFFPEVRSAGFEPARPVGQPARRGESPLCIPIPPRSRVSNFRLLLKKGEGCYCR